MEVVQHELANGARVLVQRRSHLPLVSMAIATRGGGLFESRAWAGMTALMSRASIKGTPSRPAARIAEEAEALGGSVSPAGGADLIEWSISVPSRHFEQAFDLLSDVAFQAHYPEPELEIERKLTLADLQHTRDDMYRYPLRLCMQHAFGGHPYGFSLDDVERGVSALTAPQLRAWRSERSQQQPWVVVVGAVDVDQVLPVIERALPHQTQPVAPAIEPAVWQAAAQQIEERDKAQSAIAIGFPAPVRNHEDEPALQVLAHAAGGLGGRFFEELRSKRSLAYTVALMPILRLAGGIFVGYIATTPEREAEARAGLFEQFASLYERPLVTDEIERAKRYTIGTWHIRRQTNAAQLDELISAHLLGRGAADIAEYEARIQAVNARRVQEVAEKYFHAERAVEGTVRGTGKSR
jgi:zinc protease